MALYIKSSPKNKSVRLRLVFARVRLINARDDQKYLLDVDLGNLRNKELYNKEIETNDKRMITISGETHEGKQMLSFPFDNFGVRLFSGNYVYEILESGIHKGAEFGGKTKSLRFGWDEKEGFEI